MQQDSQVITVPREMAWNDCNIAEWVFKPKLKQTCQLIFHDLIFQHIQMHKLEYELWRYMYASDRHLHSLWSFRIVYNCNMCKDTLISGTDKVGIWW